MDLYLILVIIATLLCSRIFSFVYAKFRVQENKIIVYSPSSSTPPSPQSSLPIHDVFPSFHGADVRKSFLIHFLKEGEFIGPELKKAILGSKIAIVLLSKRYASSSWCLDDLVEIMKCKEDIGQTVMLVFYQVDPSDVKKQAGEKFFKETFKGKTNEVTGKWSQALAKVATLAGYHSNNWFFSIFVHQKLKVRILVPTADVASKFFNSTLPRYLDKFIGMEAHMNKISRVLRRDLDEVRMIGILGPAGIGKTTIARCLFNQLSHTFQYSVFMMNVKAMYTPPVCSDDYNVKLHLQQKLLSQLLNQKEDLKISHLGVAQEILKDKKVLVVLDNVDRLVQLEAMAKETRWFGHGSQIIITTQDRKILEAHEICHIYKVDFPSTCEAIQMFCMYAFSQKSPKDGFEKLVWEVTGLAGNLPLGLKVMGSYFRGMSKPEWESELPKLRMCLDGEIESILMFGYIALSHENKDLFLHIACFFNFERIEKVVEHLSNGFSDVRQRLNVLAEKSLISLEIGWVRMHDLLVQLGRDIVRKQFIEPGQCQFLVDERETFEVLADDAAGSRSVIGIKFRGDNINVSERAFEGIETGGDTFHLFGGPIYLSPKHRLLVWRYFPMTSLHCIPNPELLVELIMFYSKLEKLEGTKPLSNLKWVNLSCSENLKDVSSLSTATSLEELDLTGCSSLVELPSSIGNAIHLKRLDLGGCSSWVELPSFIGNATNLQFLSLNRCSSLDLDFSDCSSLVGVPFSIGNASNLKRLYFIRCSSLVELPASIGDLHELESLILRECSKLEVLSVNINLKSLTKLDLTDCSLMKSFPEISTNIEYMYLTGTAIKQMPSSISLWPRRLDELHMSYNENLEEFPHVLDIMTDLVMSNTEIQEISPWIKRSSRLRRLVLNGCKDLLSLPQLPSSLSELDAENCESLERLDCSFLNQKIALNFANCFKLNKEARDVIIKTSTNEVTMLPGKEMPNYFNYQANGGSLVMKLNERPSRSPIIWKACILLVSKDEVEAGKGKRMDVDHGIKQNSLDVPCSPFYHTLYHPLTEHLYIFEFEAEVTSDKLCLKFEVKLPKFFSECEADSEEWMIKESGVHYLNTS
ncbi:hypothetical protein Bca4012_084527 [Brassica carinata]|uniref:TIR domain-containing protein n=1 Tax=Brassica carinata TaxID=52824 RepID=A0A8X7SH49_BRACI|nr:hypothetical protein Bca52824_026203 [Brassica carinata]